MNRCEQNVAAVIVVKPWSILLLSDLECSKWRAHGCLHCEWFMADQRLHDLLGSITVVHVKINDCDFLDLVTILGHRITGRHCHVVDKAKSIAAGFVWVVIVESPAEDSRMVAGRSRGAKCISVFPAHHCINCLHSCPCGQQRCLPCHL